MKKIIFVIGILILTSCTPFNKQMIWEKNFHGRHELKRINVYDQITKKTTCSFFMIIESSKSNSIIRLNWKHPDGSYVYSEVDYNKIKIRITNTNKPYIEFKLKERTQYVKDGDKISEETYDYFMSIEGGIEYWVDYIIIYCNENDFPTDINLNNLK